MRRVPALDGVRGVAAVLPIIAHCWRVPGWTPYVGALGVDVFLAISGFLVGGGLLDTVGRPGWARAYAIRRVTRILPLLAVVCALGAAGDVYLGTGPSRWWAALALLANVVPGSPIAHWSLSLEEQAYLLLPAAVALLRRPALARVLVGVVMAAPVVRAATYLLVGAAESYRWTPGRLDGIAWGVLAALAVREAPDIARRVARWVLPLAAAYVLADLVGAATTPPHALRLAHSATAIVASALVVVVTSPGAPALVGRAWAPPRWAGVRCYGVYLWHALALPYSAAWALRVDDTGSGGLYTGAWALATTALALPLSALSWRYLEEPANAWARRVTSTPARAPAYSARERVSSVT